MKYFLFFFLIPVHLAVAQIDSLLRNDFKDFVNVSADFYTSPLRFDSKDWIKLSAVIGIIGIIGIATLADKEIKNFSQKNQNKFSNGLFSVDKYYYIEFVGASIIGFYGCGLIADNSKLRNLAVKLTEATMLASSLNLITKIVIGRDRPYKQESQYFTNPFTFNNDSNSFPSGHATLAFAYSTVMANEVDNVFWKIGWYSLAGLVGYSRIYHNQHWYSDILMSGTIGYFSGEFVNNHNPTEKETTQINLFPAPNGFAIQIVF